ncbi:hypothetical protein K438DRAFT_1998265 [Mycena galopus ATCC 62051]|nr:hypothetical protein K438DRAFT_1998265 [Mycena galopus ATCC 62051]
MHPTPPSPQQTSGNFAVLATGISQSALAALVQHVVVSKSTAPAPTSSPTSYFGGESRLEAHGAPQTIFIGFGTAGVPAPELAAFAAYLDPNPSVKWAKSPYSDAALVGLLVQGPTAALKGTNGSIKPEELKAAVAKAKFRLAASADGRAGVNQYSSPGSSSSSSPSSNPSDANGNPPRRVSSPPSFLEPTGTSDALVPDHVRLRMEFARMRLRGHLHSGRAVHNAFDNPAVRRRCSPPKCPPVGTSDPLALAPFAAPAPAPSFIVQKWHRLKKESEARREDQATS